MSNVILLTIIKDNAWIIFRIYPSISNNMNKLMNSAVGVLIVLGGLFTTAPAFAQTVDTTPPSTPIITSITVASSAKIDVNWSVSTDNIAVTGYNVYRNSILIAKTSGNSYSDMGLAASSNHNYAIAAFDAAGNTSNQSGSVSITTLATSSDLIVPSAPSGLLATVISISQINLNWTASTDNTGVTGYKIYRNGIVVGSSASTTFADTGLLPQTAYSYTVAAFDATGNLSSQSGSVTATTAAVAPDSLAPTIPANLTATAISSSKINLNWTASTDNVAVKGYKIFRNNVLIGTTTGTSFSDRGLLAQTTYSYRVSAFDAANNVSGLSNAASATTLSLNANNRHDDDDDDGDRHHRRGHRHHDDDDDHKHKGRGHHGDLGLSMRVDNDHHQSRLSRSGRR